jgi:hypothetical protein
MPLLAVHSILDMGKIFPGDRWGLLVRALKSITARMLLQEFPELKRMRSLSNSHPKMSIKKALKTLQRLKSILTTF